MRLCRDGRIVERPAVPERLRRIWIAKMPSQVGSWCFSFYMPGLEGKTIIAPLYCVNSQQFDGFTVGGMAIGFGPCFLAVCQRGGCNQAFRRDEMFESGQPVKVIL